MPDLSSAFVRLIIPRLGLEEGAPEGIRTWLTRSRYRPTEESTAEQFWLTNFDPWEFVKFLAFDYERFALSSYESFRVSALENRSHHLIGWPLLKLYYSGFFAAHAVMRASGSGLVKLERAQVDVLRNAIQIYTGVPCAIRPGMFLFQLVQESGIISFTPQSESRGAHESFWKVFVEFLGRSAERAVVLDIPDANTLVAAVHELSQLIRGKQHGDGFWYSAVRNELN